MAVAVAVAAAMGVAVAAAMGVAVVAAMGAAMVRAIWRGQRLRGALTRRWVATTDLLCSTLSVLQGSRPRANIDLSRSQKDAIELNY